MNAVNLIPRESRPGRLSLTTSPQTLALFAGLTALLVAAFVYVSAANKVTAHRNELAKVTASASAWKTFRSVPGGSSTKWSEQSLENGRRSNWRCAHCSRTATC